MVGPAPSNHTNAVLSALRAAGLIVEPRVPAELIHRARGGRAIDERAQWPRSALGIALGQGDAAGGWPQ